MLEISVQVDAHKAEADFKEARKEIGNRVKLGLKTAGETVALPAVRAHAPVKTGKLRESLYVRASRTGAVITNRRSVPYVGLQEFGGTVRKWITPKHKKALYINGHFVTTVRTPRTYKAKSFIVTALDENRTQIEEAVADEILKAF